TSLEQLCGPSASPRAPGWGARGELPARFERDQSARGGCSRADGRATGRDALLARGVAEANVSRRPEAAARHRGDVCLLEHPERDVFFVRDLLAVPVEPVETAHVGEGVERAVGLPALDARNRREARDHRVAALLER